MCHVIFVIFEESEVFLSNISNSEDIAEEAISDATLPLHAQPQKHELELCHSEVRNNYIFFIDRG